MTIGAWQLPAGRHQLVLRNDPGPAGKTGSPESKLIRIELHSGR
jgi:hypothetical protein